MELVEFEEKRRMRREEAAKWLHELADTLARNNEVRWTRDGLPFTVKVPDEVSVKVELEVGDESELEIELSW